MTISTETSRDDYTGNDSTAVYAYTYRVFSEDDLVVLVRETSSGTETTLTKTTDYTVDGVGDVGGGDVTLAGTGKAWQGTGSQLDTGYSLTIRRVVDLTQQTDIRNQGAFYPEVHEDQFDKLVMQNQAQQDDLVRSARMPQSVPSSDFDTTLPADIVGEVGVTVMTNPSGDGFVVGPTSSEIASASGYASAAANSATEADTSATSAGISETNASDSETAAAASAAAAAASAGSVEKVGYSGIGGWASTNIFTPYFTTSDVNTLSAFATLSNNTTTGVKLTINQDCHISGWVQSGDGTASTLAVILNSLNDAQNPTADQPNTQMGFHATNTATDKHCTVSYRVEDGDEIIIKLSSATTGTSADWSFQFAFSATS